MREIQLSESVMEVNERLLTEITPAMVQMGYTLVSQGDRTLTFTKRYRPTWATVLAIVGLLFFLLGLLFLLVKETETVLVTLSVKDGGASVLVTGARKPWVGEAIERRLTEEAAQS